MNKYKYTASKAYSLHVYLMLPEYLIQIKVKLKSVTRYLFLTHFYRYLLLVQLVWMVDMEDVCWRLE